MWDTVLITRSEGATRPRWSNRGRRETTEGEGMIAWGHESSGNSPGPPSPSAKWQINKNNGATTLGWLEHLRGHTAYLHWLERGNQEKQYEIGISKWISRSGGWHRAVQWENVPEICRDYVLRRKDGQVQPGWVMTDWLLVWLRRWAYLRIPPGGITWLGEETCKGLGGLS